MLLILAAVSIATLTGENGLLTKTSDAKTQQIHSTVEEGVLIAYNEYQIGKNVSDSANTTFLEYLKQQEYANEEGIINIEKLIGKKLELGNGTSTTDIYKIEEIENSYELRYYNKEASVEILNKISISAKKEKLSNSVKIGDFVTYNKEYVNPTGVNETIGTGWRVSYVDKENDIVKLIPEGIISGDILAFVDETVAEKIELMTLQDIQDICAQGNMQFRATTDDIGTTDEPFRYEIISDDIGIICIDAVYGINTVATDWYGEAGNMWVRENYVEYFSEDKPSVLGQRPVVTLKTGIEYTTGNGSSSSPYNIY